MSCLEALAEMTGDDNFSICLQLYRDGIEQQRQTSQDRLCNDMLEALNLGLTELEYEHSRKRDARTAQQLAADEIEDEFHDCAKFEHDIVANAEDSATLCQTALEVDDDALEKLDTQQDSQVSQLYDNVVVDVSQDNDCEYREHGQHKRRCICCDGEQSLETSHQNDCGHVYCGDCLTTLVANTMKDETLLPAKCCRIPFETTSQELTALLSTQLLDDYTKKLIEHETVDKTYCSNQVCSKLIKDGPCPWGYGRCDACSNYTCMKCKGAIHDGRPCPPSEAEIMLINLAKQEEWRQCQLCKVFVELGSGCNHITCRCGHQFCYLCGVQWKNCGCEQWEEDRLLGRARRDVQRDDPVDGAHIQAVVEVLEQEHNRDHVGLRRIPGNHVCQGCGWQSTEYILECQECRYRTCWRCEIGV